MSTSFGDSSLNGTASNAPSNTQYNDIGYYNPPGSSSPNPYGLIGTDPNSLQSLMNMLGGSGPAYAGGLNDLLAQLQQGKWNNQLGNNQLANNISLANIGANQAQNVASIGTMGQLAAISKLFPGGVGSALSGIFSGMNGGGNSLPMGMQSSSGAGFSFGGTGAAGTGGAGSLNGIASGQGSPAAQSSGWGMPFPRELSGMITPTQRPAAGPPSAYGTFLNQIGGIA